MKQRITEKVKYKQHTTDQPPNKMRNPIRHEINEKEREKERKKKWINRLIHPQNSYHRYFAQYSTLLFRIHLFSSLECCNSQQPYHLTVKLWLPKQSL